MCIKTRKCLLLYIVEDFANNKKYSRDLVSRGSVKSCV